MKVLNNSEVSIFLDDIDLIVTYSRSRTPQEIDDKLAKKSKMLRLAFQREWLIDVTKGIPEKLPEIKSFDAFGKAPEPKPETEASPYYDPESPYFKNQAKISKPDHFKPEMARSPQEKAVSAMAEEKRFVRSIGKMPSAKKWLADTGEYSIAWTGPAADGGGYARMNRKFMSGLTDLGVRIRYDKIDSINDMDAKTMSQLGKLEGVSIPEDAPKIYGMTAPLCYDWARKKILFTMMETRFLHKDYVLRCNCADHIVVPSKWCLQEFRDSGVTVPMSVVPLGVDTNIYTPTAEPVGFTKQAKKFIFLSVFGWSMRKGYDVLLKAYLEEFSSDEDVTLLISSRYFGSTDDCKKQVIRNDIERVKKTIKKPADKMPHLMLFGDVLSDAMMPRLYASCDAYVLFSRGEGFGLPYAEAGACKMPVIATRYSGQTDFLDDDNSYLVDVDGFSKADKSLAQVSYFYEDAEFPTLGPAVIEQARVAMRRVFENKAEANAKAAKLHEKITKEYNWQVCIEQMKDRVKDFYSKM